MIYIYNADKDINKEELESKLGVEVELSDDKKQVKKVVNLLSKKYSMLYIDNSYILTDVLKHIPNNVVQYGTLEELHQLLGIPFNRQSHESSSGIKATTLNPVKEEDIPDVSVSEEMDYGITIGGSYMEFETEDGDTESKTQILDEKTIENGIIEPIESVVDETANETSLELGDINENGIDTYINSGANYLDDVPNISSIATETGFEGIDLDSIYAAMDYDAEQEQRAREDILKSKDAIIQEKDNEVFELSAKLEEARKELEEGSKNNTLKYDELKSKYSLALSTIETLKKEKAEFVEYANAEKRAIVDKLTSVQEHFKYMRNVLNKPGVDVCLKYLASPAGVLQGSTKQQINVGDANIKVIAVASSNELKVITKELGQKIRSKEKIVVADFTCGCVVNTALNLRKNNSFQLASSDVKDLDSIGTKIENSIIFGSNIAHDIALLSLDWEKIINNLIMYAGGNAIYIVLGSVSSFAVSYILSALCTQIYSEVYIHSTPYNLLSVYTMLICGKELKGLHYKLLDTVPAVNKVIEDVFKGVSYKMYPLNSDTRKIFDERC